MSSPATTDMSDEWQNLSDVVYNLSSNHTSSGSPKVFNLLCSLFYLVICLVGLVGNTLVIFVVLRYAEMKTVTNTYILNLAIADVLFLIELPLLTTTTILENWVFGYALCKIYYILTSVNSFTGIFTLTVMSADRFMAVCYPVSSIKYRTPFYGRIICFVVWSLSVMLIMPIIIYSDVESRSESIACVPKWPRGGKFPSQRMFFLWSFIIGFVIPIVLICVFYTCVVVRLRRAGPANRSREKKRSQRKVTTLVLCIIFAYVVCWLPYWIFQEILIFGEIKPNVWTKNLFQIFTILSYSNSMINPVLYAFVSENFRKSFQKAFSCSVDEL